MAMHYKPSKLHDVTEETVQSGMAQERMQKILLETYQMTPELEREMPKKNSKILAPLELKKQQQKPMTQVDKETLSGKIISKFMLLYRWSK